MFSLADGADHLPGNLGGADRPVFGPFRVFRALDYPIEKFGLRRAGTDDQYVDSQLGELGADRLAEALHGELAGRVFAAVRHAAMPEDRTDVDHDRTIALLQQRQREPDHLDGGEEIHFHQAADPIGVGVDEQTHRADAGVVDQNIQTAELLSGGVDRPLPDGPVGYVADDRFDRSPDGGDLIGYFLQPILAPGNEDQSSAVAGKFEGRLAADAAAGAGDDRTSAV